jgi:hypothetical protein
VYWLLAILLAIRSPFDPAESDIPMRHAPGKSLRRLGLYDILPGLGR